MKHKATKKSLPTQRPTLQTTPLLLDVTRRIVFILVVYALINLASARFMVLGISMEPSFVEGQLLVVSRLHYLMGEPQRGDIVVFHYPDVSTEDYIKRIIGLPGDVVEIRGTLVYVNGEILEELYIQEPCQPQNCEPLIWRLDGKEYFVMGDNRNHSSDSRAFGPILREYLIGKVVLRYFPLGDGGIIQ
jgi:signal peptidase I